jgi:hypothetical protein
MINAAVKRAEQIPRPIAMYLRAVRIASKMNIEYPFGSQNLKTVLGSLSLMSVS